MCHDQIDQICIVLPLTNNCFVAISKKKLCDSDFGLFQYYISSLLPNNFFLKKRKLFLGILHQT